jgi:3-phenylpropionate/trans-cinnamate dioxygenase ferredoxin reductase subunit
MTRHVIIGAGEAGLRAAAALRDVNQNVTLIGAEDWVPYERPALSKPDATGEVFKPIAVDLAGIDARFGVTVAQNDRSARVVVLADGTQLPYDRLLLATGATPRRLPFDPDGHALTLRTLSDARAILSRALAGDKAVLIGAGLIGLETAAELTRRGMSVTVLEAGPRALGRALPADVAEVVSDRHREAGVTLRFGVGIGSVDADGVTLTDGSKLTSDLTVCAIGVTPETALAEAAGLSCANGILVDARLATTDPAIFAAGDCAAVDHPRYGRFRFETWRNACDQGTLAARSMLGQDAVFDALPWFWSDQFDLGLQTVGLHEPSRRAIRRDLSQGGWIRFELDGAGTLVAACGIGPGNAVAKDIRLTEKLIEKGAVVAPEFLADSTANLKSALKDA